MTTPATARMARTRIAELDQQERQAVRNKARTDSIVGELITRPQFRFVNPRIVAEVVRLTVCAICGPEGR